MIIPHFLDKEEYLQIPIIKRFLKAHDLEMTGNKADYINSIQEYSDKSEENEQEVKAWLLKVAKEGSKEICYRKIYGIEDWHKNKQLMDAKIRELYPNCPMQDILSYVNTGERNMIEYNIIINDDGEVIKIDFTYSKLFLQGTVGTLGDRTIFPVFIEIYLDTGFIISRAKAKSTLFVYDEDNAFLDSESKLDTMSYAVDIIDKLADYFGFETERSPKIAKCINSQMLYRIYQKYSFTPEDVVQKIETQDALINGFVDQFFSNLDLDVRNKGKARLDAKILVEKFISINGDNEEVFKEL